MQRQLLQQQGAVGLLIGAARSRIKQAVGKRASRYGLSPQQFWVLVTIQEREGLSLRDLAERLWMDSPTASRIVAALARRRLVRIQGDPADRRRSRLLLTAMGKSLSPELRALAAKVRDAIVEGLSASDQDSLRGSLRAIIENMERFERDGERRLATPIDARGRERR